MADTPPEAVPTEVIPVEDTAPKAVHREVVPVEGWSLHSTYGVLKTNTGMNLVRLQDVHAWLMQAKGMPSDSAAARVFAVFISDAGSELGMQHGAEALFGHLYVTDSSSHPDRIQSFVGGLFWGEVIEWMPYVPHHHFEQGTRQAIIYALGVLAGEVWAPHCRDVDLDSRLERYCPEGNFPSAERAREILGRLAVPFPLAFKLWGWGTVAETSSPAAGALESAPVVEAPPPQSRLEVLAQRRSKHTEWTAEDRAELLAIFNELKDRLGTSKAHSTMAKALGMSSRLGVKKQIDIAQGQADENRRSGIGSVVHWMDSSDSAKRRNGTG